MLLIARLETYAHSEDLGITLGPDAPLRLAPGIVRMPDVSFISWNRFPNRLLPAEPILDMAPDLAVEVLSAGNTAREMERKLREYFAAGARLVWVADPEARTVRVHRSPDDSTLLSGNDTLDGGDVLPGFSLPVRQWFDQAGRRDR